MEVTVKIQNEEGMHARPAGVFVKAASQFKSKIDVSAHGKKMNGKSVMSLMSLQLQFNDELIIWAEGEDAQMALETLEKLVKNKFKLATEG